MAQQPALYPVPAHGFLSEYPVPRLADYLVTLRQDSNASGYAVPAPGDAYPTATIQGGPDYAAWKFVKAIPDKDGTGWVIHFYAPIRTEEDTYNYEITYPYGGRTAFPRYTRAYLALRSTIESTGKVEQGTSDPVHSSAKLVEQQVKRDESSIYDSLFVFVVRVYDTIPDLSNSGQLDIVKTFGYAVTYPYGVKEYPRVTWKAPGLVVPTIMPLADVCPVPGYTAATISAPPMYLIEAEAMTADGVLVGSTRVYERIPGPVLVLSDFDQTTSKVKRVTKQTVATSTVPATADLLDAEVNGYDAVKTVQSLVAGLVGCTAHGYSIGDEIIFPSPLALNHLSLTSVATTSGSTVITCASTAGFHMGSLLAGTGIQAGSSIHRILSSTSLEMTYAATASNTGQTLTSDELGMTIGNAQGAGAYYVSSIPNANSFYFTDIWGGSPNIYPTATGGGFVLRRTTPRGTTISYAPKGDSALLSIRTVTTSPLLSLDFLHGAADFDLPGNHEYNWPDVLNAATYYAVAAAWGDGYAGDVSLKLGITEGPQGKSKALIRKRYTSNPQAPGFLDSLPPIQRWFKSAQSLAAAYAIVESDRPRASARMFQIPATLHPAGTADVSGDASLYSAAGVLDTTIYGSYPTTIPPGWIVADVVPHQLFDGMWEYHIILVRLF